MNFRRKVLTAFRTYQLPVISLGKTTSKEAVCLVFEKVNTGGVPLSVFELVTASFAAENYNLRDDWHGNKARNVKGRAERIKDEAILETVEPTDFLQAVCLLHTYEKRQNDVAAGKTGKAAAAVSAKRAAVLDLSLDEYQRWASKVEADTVFKVNKGSLSCTFMGCQCAIQRSRRAIARGLCRNHTRSSAQGRSRHGGRATASTRTLLWLRPRQNQR